MQNDTNLERAIAQVDAALAGTQAVPLVKAFFDEPTFTATYVVSDPATGKAAIIDSVLDFDQASGCTGFASADAVIEYVQQEGLTIDWLLETHAHADHLSAAPYLQEKLGGKLAIGAEIVTVQNVFGKIFNEGTRFQRDGSQFDVLLRGEGLLDLEAGRGGAHAAAFVGASARARRKSAALLARLAALKIARLSLRRTASQWPM